MNCAARRSQIGAGEDAALKYVTALVFIALAPHALAQPRVLVTAPAPGTQYLAPVSISISATTTPPAARLDFLANGELIGTTTSNSFVWSNAPLGTHRLQARVVESDGSVSLSPPVPIQVTDRDSGRVNSAPSVQLTSPASGTVFATPATVTLTASAADGDGTVTQVDFYQGGALVGSSTSAPHSVTLANLASGTYSFLALAIDDLSAASVSATVNVIVNTPPSIALTSPGNNATFKAPAAIPLAVEVADSDGSIASVDFFFGDTLIASRTAPPYAITWTEVPQGTYSLTARVTDNLGASATSASIT